MPAQKAEYSTLATVSMTGGRPGNPQTPYRCMWFMWAVIILNGLSVTLLAFNSIRTNDKLELLGAQLTQLQVEVHVEADELGLPWLGVDSDEEEELGPLDDGDNKVQDEVDDDEEDEEEGGEEEQEMVDGRHTTPAGSVQQLSRKRRNAENDAHDRRRTKSEKKKKTKKEKKNKKGKKKGKQNKLVKQIKDIISTELLPVQENIDVTRANVFYLLNRSQVPQNESSFHVTLPHVGSGKFIPSTATSRTIEWAAADDLSHLQAFEMNGSLYVTVPQTGYYYLYSQITYHGQSAGFSFTGPACEHAVRRTRAMSDGQRDDVELMKSSVTQHNHGRPQAVRDTLKYPVDTSVNGGVFILHQGDLLSIMITENTKVCYITTDPSTTFFGAHRVAGII